MTMIETYCPGCGYPLCAACGRCEDCDDYVCEEPTHQDEEPTP